MKVEFTPATIEARIYETGGYKERSAYVGSFIIQVMGDEAWISLLTNVEESECYAWTKGIEQQTREHLRRMGIRWVTYECKGQKVRRDIASGHAKADRRPAA